jgi:histidine triad (HIT) family protein
MFNHAPADYRCPFCLLAQGTDNENVLSRQEDIVLRDESILAFVSSHWWERNPGHVQVIPRAHYENIYDLPAELGARIFDASKRIAVAMKLAYGCDGVSTRQHNEPAGCQEVWHYHVHVFPRYEHDDLYRNHESRRLTTPAERLIYAEKLRVELDNGD